MSGTIQRTGYTFAQAMKVASSPEEWKSRGIKVVSVVDHHIHCVFIVINLYTTKQCYLLVCYFIIFLAT